MNYLAHLRLAPDDPGHRVGNLLGDFAKGLDVAALPDALRQGVELHRAVDRFTDAHPAFRRSRSRVPAPLARYSGVLVDIFYDHFLARHWDRFGTDQSLTAFTNACYAALADHEHALPARMNHSVFHLRRLDWLGRYRDIFHVDAVLEKVALRLRRPSSLAQGGSALRAGYSGFERDFFGFFPQVQAMARARAPT